MSSTHRRSPTSNPVLREMTAGHVVVGHRLVFDAQFWAESCRRNGLVPPPRSGLCSKVLARAAGHRDALTQIAGRYGLVNGSAHEALNDAKMAARVAMRAVTDLGGIAAAREQHRLFATQQLALVIANPTATDTGMYRRAHGSLGPSSDRYDIEMSLAERFVYVIENVTLAGLLGSKPTQVLFMSTPASPTSKPVP